MISNGNDAQLLLLVPDEEKIVSFSSSLVLPIEGAEKDLYTVKEIELFLAQV
jgi:hypothetical protein